MSLFRPRVRIGQGRPNAPLPSVVLACAIASSLLLGACGRSRAAADPPGPPALPVKVQTIATHDVGETSEYVATIKSRNSATIMSDVEGWIFAIHAHSGDFVKKGQTLMEIDPRRQQAAVSSLRLAAYFQRGDSAMDETTVGARQGSLRVGSHEQAGLRPGAIEL